MQRFRPSSISPPPTSMLLAWVFLLLVMAGSDASALQQPDATTEPAAQAKTLPEIPPDADEEGYSVEIRQLETRHTAFIRFQTPASELSSHLAEVLPKVYAYVLAQGLEPGTPYSLYHSTDGETLDMEAGVLVASAMEGSEEIRSGTLPAGEALFTLHPGPYSNLPQAYRALDNWLADHGRTGGVIWELYITDPGAEPDQRRWRTEVYRELDPAAP